MIEWTSAKDRLPISGHNDSNYTPPFYELDVIVKLANGAECNAVFWACWDVSKNIEDNSEFIMDFDVKGVEYWRLP